MRKHIKNFYIDSYRGINNLNIDDLNLINIFTGDNNSGKTSVLELISTIDNPQKTHSWIVCSRKSVFQKRKRQFFKGFYNMFPIDSDKKRISYTFVDENDISHNIALVAQIEGTQISEKEMYRINGLLKTGSPKQEDDILDTLCMNLYTYINGKKVNEDKIYDFQNKISTFIIKDNTFVKTIYVSPVDHATDMFNLNYILSEPELYNDMLNILQSLDENITNINAIQAGDSILYSEYMVFTKNHSKALPLSSYGDGMKKAMLLLNAVVLASNGILLLDEFETAIHTSAMDSVFSWLLQSAIKLNVQIFLSSHSKEAIEKILECNEQLKKYINLYTLYNFEGKNYVRKMTCEEAINAKDNLGLELR